MTVLLKNASLRNTKVYYAPDLALELARDITLGLNGSNIGYISGTMGSLSDDSFGSDTILSLYETRSGSTDIFVFDVDNDSLSQNAFTTLKLQKADYSVVELQSADANFNIPFSGRVRWQWLNQDIWVLADDGKTRGWEIIF